MSATGVPAELTRRVYCNRVKLSFHLDKSVSPNTFEFAAFIFQNEGFKVLALASVIMVASACVIAPASETRLMYGYASAWAVRGPGGNLCHAAATSGG